MSYTVEQIGDAYKELLNVRGKCYRIHESLPEWRAIIQQFEELSRIENYPRLSPEKAQKAMEMNEFAEYFQPATLNNDYGLREICFRAQVGFQELPHNDMETMRASFPDFQEKLNEIQNVLRELKRVTNFRISDEEYCAELAYEGKHVDPSQLTIID